MVLRKQVSTVLFGLVLVLSIMAGLQILTSCSLVGSESEESLNGYWKSSYGDGFEIYYDYDNLVLKYKQYNNTEKDVSFAGTVVNNPDLTAASGYIIIQITEAGTWEKTVGSYYACHWKDFTGDTVKHAAAFKVGGTNNNGMETAADAEQEYTVENGYYALHGDYERQ